MMKAIRETFVWAEEDQGEVSLLITDDEEIAELNQRYRGVSGPTDVLSFSNEPDSGIWGDIVVSWETAQRQAKTHGLTLSEEMRFLCIHGSLHLLGWKDESETEYEEMIRAMQDVSPRCGLNWKNHWAESKGGQQLGCS